MPSLSKYTQWKVIGGYSLLFLLSILAAVLIYKQITKLIVNEENSDNPNRKLFIIGNTITGLYESEGLGNAFVQTGSRSYFLKYRDLIEEYRRCSLNEDCNMYPLFHFIGTQRWHLCVWITL